MKCFLGRRHQVIPSRSILFTPPRLPPSANFIRSITKIKPQRYAKSLTYKSAKEHQLRLHEKELKHEAYGRKWLKALNLLEKPSNKSVVSPVEESLRNMLMDSSDQLGLASAEEDPDSEVEKAHKKVNMAVRFIDVDPKKALEIFNEVLAIDPKLAPALFGRAVIHESNGNIDQSYADYKALSELLHAKWTNPHLPYRLRYDDRVLYNADTRLIMMDLERGNLAEANKRLFTMLEHAPDEELYRLATAVNGDITRMFHDVGNKADHYYRDILRGVPFVIRWTDRGRSLHATMDINEGETVCVEKPLVSVPHNDGKKISCCHFCGKIDNDVLMTEPVIDSVPPEIRELFRKPEKLALSHVPGEELEKWAKVHAEESKHPKKDPNYISEFDFRLKLRENGQNFEAFAQSLRATAGVNPFDLYRDSNGRIFCSQQCKEASHAMFAPVDSHPSFTKLEKIAQKYDNYTGILMARIFAIFEYQTKNHVTPTVLDHLFRMTHPMTPGTIILSEGENEEIELLKELFAEESTRKYINPRHYFQLKSIINFNSFELPSQALLIAVPKSFESEQGEVIVSYEDKVSNTTILLVGSYLQHSCAPNVVPKPVLNGTKEIGLVTTRPIAKGEMLSWSFVDETLPVKERRQILQDRFFIDCKCPRCFAELNAESRSTTLLREQDEREKKQREEQVRAQIRKEMEERRLRRHTVDAEHTGPFFPVEETQVQNDIQPDGQVLEQENQNVGSTQQGTTIDSGFQEEGEVVLVQPQKEHAVNENSKEESIVQETTGSRFEGEGEVLLANTEEHVEEAVIVEKPKTQVPKSEQSEQAKPIEQLEKENERLIQALEKNRLLLEIEKKKKELELLEQQLKEEQEKKAQQQAATPSKPTEPPRRTASSVFTIPKTNVTQPEPTPIKLEKISLPRPPSRGSVITVDQLLEEENDYPFEKEHSTFVPSDGLSYMATDDQVFLDEHNPNVPLWEEFEPPAPQPEPSIPVIEVKREENPFGEEELIQSNPIEDVSLTESITDPVEMLLRLDIPESVVHLVKKKIQEDQKNREEKLSEDLMDLLQQQNDRRS